MRLLGFDITRAKAYTVPTNPNYRGLFGYVHEPYAGAWQRNEECRLPTNDVLANPAVYSCVNLIAGDISKLRIKLVQYDSGIWQEVVSQSPFLPVLRKPNRYQTRVQFLSQWVISLLLYGNTYVLKERDNRGIVTSLYILDPRRVTTKVTNDGDVYYDVHQDELAGARTQITVPASEIIHDRYLCLFHPLVGVAPMHAAVLAASQGIKISEHSARFFANMSRPSGMLTAPQKISDETAQRLKQAFEAGFSGANIGKLFVGGDGLEFEPITMPADQAQLVEQLGMTAADVARAFNVPGYKIGLGSDLKFNNMAVLNQDYYSQCLQARIESIEACIDEGLGLENYQGNRYGVELDLKGLLRMDPLSRAEIAVKRLDAGMTSPDEERAEEDMPPVDGGKTPYMQQQKYPIARLDRPIETPTAPTPTAEPAPTPEKAITLEEGEFSGLLKAA